VAGWARGNSQASAEIKSIAAIRQETGEELDVHLVSTDTVLSRLAAEIIRDLLREATGSGTEVIFDPNTDCIKGLQVGDAREFFRQGMVNLVQRLEEICGGYFGNVIFNITGGYKASIPYLTIMAQVNGAPICYIFEDTNKLIWIPQAPVDINWGLFEKYRMHIDDLSKGVTGMTWAEYRRSNILQDDFPEIVWHDDADRLIELNAIGRHFYQRYKRWSLVFVLSGGPFSEKSALRSRSAINRAIEELNARLNEFVVNNRLENDERQAVHDAVAAQGGDPLSHAGRAKDAFFIAKCPKNEPEIRLLYDFDWEGGAITRLTVYDFRIGQFHDRQNYVEDFRTFYNNNRDKAKVPYLQLQQNTEGE
jgi:putative CRISPR-associated protein (TIGR02619 family)